MTNSRQKNTSINTDKGIPNINNISVETCKKSTQESVPFTFSKIKKNGETLTKKVSLVDGRVISDASECRMSRGRSEQVSLTLPEFPTFLRSLKPNEAIATGWVNGTVSEYEILPKEKFLSLGAEFPATSFEHGHYSTRTKDSFHQEGSSLIVFDYDHDENAEIQLTCPEDFIKLLATVIPKFDEVSYVRTYSTSSAIYEKGSDKCYRPADGFHIYMVIDDGSDLVDFGERLNKHLWLKGYGHVKVSKSAALLKRTLVDVAVFSPERLIFEAGAVVSPELEQRLPTPEYVERPLASFNTRQLKPLTAKQEQQRLMEEKLVQTSEKVLAAQSEVRKALVLELIGKQEADGKNLTVRQAEKIVEAKMNHQLTYDTVISFENGDDLTVAELLFKADQYDKMMCLDPLREEKGFGKVQFYANAESGHPIIHSFVEGGRIYRLLESITTEDELDPSVYTEHFRELASSLALQDNRYLELPALREGITVIRSQKGTGKTFGLARWLEEHPDLRVLNVTHRVSLARALGTNFKMDIYNDESMTSTKLVCSQRLSCCYDSVYKLSRQHYDVVILDEAVQVMRHIIADTVKEKFLCLNVLLNIIYNAKYVIMMDADFQAFHVEFLKTIDLIRAETKINVVLNTHQPAKGNKVTLLQDGDGRADELSLLARMVDTARQGGLFYASNSVKDVELKAEQVLRELGHNLPVKKGDFILEVGGRRTIIISGNNSGNAEVQEFIDHINERIRDDDMIFCSPSMGTGVSIDSVGGKPRFGEVFSRFTKRAGNIPSDCIQHMARVRDCTKTTLTIVDDSSYECTNADQIIEERLLTAVRLVDSKTNPFQHCLNFNSWTGQYEWGDSGYSHWLGFIRGMEAQERNLFGNHLRLQLEQEGYELDYKVLNAKDEQAEERQALDSRVKAQKAEAKELEYQLRSNTPLIGDDEYKALKNRKNLRMDDRRKVDKKYYADIMGMVYVDDVNDLICQSDAKRDERVGGLTLGMDPKALLVKEISDRVNGTKQHLDKTTGFEKYKLSVSLAKVMGVHVEDGKITSTFDEITDEVIDEAYALLRQYPNATKRLFKTSVPKNVDKQKRSQKVLSILKRIGISTIRKSNRAVEGVQKVRYIDERSIQQINLDVNRARKHSVLSGFNPPKASGEFDTYLLYNESNLCHLMPDVHNYIYSLKPESLADLNDALNLKDDKQLGGVVAEGEPMYDYEM